MGLSKIIFSLICLFLFYNSVYSQKKTDIDTINEIETQIKDDVENQYKSEFDYKLIEGQSFRNCKSNHYAKYIKNLVFDIQDMDSLTFGMKLYKLKVSNYFKDNEGFVKLPYTFINDLGLDYGLLIGYTDECVKILSGNICNSIYSDIFNLQNSKIETYIKFLEIKLFVFNIKKLKYEKQNKKWIFVSGLETIFKKQYKVYYKVNKDFPDIVIKLGHKISGKYTNSEKVIIN